MYQLVTPCVQLTSLTKMNFSISDGDGTFYGVANGNARFTRESWINRFPNRAIPCANIYISDKAEIREAEEQILDRIEEKPDISTR